MGNRKRKGKSNSKSFYQHRKGDQKPLAILDHKKDQKPLAILEDEDDVDFSQWMGNQPDYVLRVTLDTLMPLYRETLVADQKHSQLPELIASLTSRSNPISTVVKAALSSHSLAEYKSESEEETYTFARPEPSRSDAQYHSMAELCLGMISTAILKTKQYHLLWDYYAYYLEYKKTNNLSQDASAMILANLVNVFWGVCYLRKAVLVGIGDYPVNKGSSNFLWIPMPDLLSEAIKDQMGWSRNDLHCGYEALMSILPFISGNPNHKAYDALMLPAQSRWPSVKDLYTYEQLNMESVLAQSLGKTEGVFSRADLQQVLEKIALERKWLLTPNRPVLVRLVDHPLIHQVILMQKDTHILAKLETHEYGDWIEVVSLNDMTWLGTFKTIRDATLQDRDNKDRKQGKVKVVDIADTLDNMAVPGLIATLVLDLVTVEDEVVATGGKRQFKSTIPQHQKPTEPKRWHWQYLPRRKYIKPSQTQTRTDLSGGKGEGEGNVIVERTALDPKQLDLQKKLKRFHMVGLFTRKLPVNQKPSPAKIAQAIDLGLKLAEGETWVATHGRGIQELKGVVEDVGIDNIPHFMKRNTGLPSA